MADILLIYNGVQIGDFVTLPDFSIERGGEPEVQIGLFKANATVLETGPNKVEIFSVHVVYLKQSGRTPWTKITTVRGWGDLMDNEAHQVAVTQGGTELFSEEDAILFSITPVEVPRDIAEAYIGVYEIKFYINS